MLRYRNAYTTGVIIGSVPYLNARPLVDWLEREAPPGVTLRYAVPSVLVRQVREGALDIAMASTFSALAYPELHLMPDIGVTVTGPAWSVRLLSRVPVKDIRTLALDASSRSTTVMARIVLADRYGVTPQCLDLPPDPQEMLEQADAAVLIGDIGLTMSGDGLLDLDMGAEWFALTGLPFFFAGWVARNPALLDHVRPLLHEALEQGLARLPGIAAEEANRLQIPSTRCHRYLAEIMRYHAGAAELAGLEAFRARAARLGLLAPGKHADGDPA